MSLRAVEKPTNFWPKAPSPPSACENPTWIDDKECDDENNNAECEWDGGDCCPETNPNPNWDNLCQECLCLGPMGL